MAAAVARALAFIFVIVQSYFKWSPDETLLEVKKNELFTTSHHLAGLVLARGGSKGIPRKNIVELNGQPLIGWSLHAMVMSHAFTSIWVSTDDPEIAEWVKKAFPSVRIHVRAQYTATDEASSIIAVQEFLSFHPEFDAIGLVQATSPFISSSYLSKAMTLLHNCPSVFAATRSHELRWKYMENPSNDATTALNFDPVNRPRRQDWSGEMVENGMFYFAMRDLITHENVFQGKRSCYVEIPKYLSLQIDTLEDLEMARFLMINRNISTRNLSGLSESGHLLKPNNFHSGNEL